MTDSIRVGQRGAVVSVNTAESKGVRKTPVPCISLIHDRGVDGDAHAGDWHRQVSLLAQESVDKMVAKGLDVTAGDFGENVTTRGLDLPALPVGTRLSVGKDVLLEISQIGKVCHTRCAIYYQAGDCVMPKEGVFAVVLGPGEIQAEDEIVITEIGDGTCDRVPQPERTESE